MRSLQTRLAGLEGRSEVSRMIVAKLPANGDVAALLADSGIVQRDGDLLVRIVRPEGCGEDSARIVQMTI